MRIFLNELQKKHRARLGALIARHKAGVGYVILLLGVLFAIGGVIGAQNSANHRDEVKSAVICENITRTDKQTLANLHTKLDKELIEALKLTTKQLNDSIHKQLVLSAEERTALQPSDPKSACFSGLTTLNTFVPPLKHTVTLPRTTRTTPHTTTTSVVILRSTPVVTSAPQPRHISRPRRAVPTPAHMPAPTPASRVNSPKAPGPPGVTIPPVATNPLPPVTIPPAPIPTPIPTPPLVKVPPITVGPITTPEVTVTTTILKL